MSLNSNNVQLEDASSHVIVPRLQGMSLSISKIFHPFAPKHCPKAPGESNKVGLMLPEGIRVGQPPE